MTSWAVWVGKIILLSDYLYRVLAVKFWDIITARGEVSPQVRNPFREVGPDANVG